MPGLLVISALLFPALFAPPSYAREITIYRYKAPAIVWDQEALMRDESAAPAPDAQDRQQERTQLRRRGQTPRLVLIIDDMGNNAELGHQAVKLPGNVTYAFLPFTPASQELAQSAHAAGKEIMLHAPMSSLHHRRLGPGALTRDMNKQQFLQSLRASIKSLPFLRGVNNHMGSELTQLSEPMSWLMEELSSQELYFIDSRTDPNSVADRQARQARIPTLSRDVFLDHDPSMEAIEQSFEEAVRVAHKTGLAVLIGHPYPSTLSYLAQRLPALANDNINLVYASQALASEALAARQSSRERDPAGDTEADATLAALANRDHGTGKTLHR